MEKRSMTCNSDLLDFCDTHGRIRSSVDLCQSSWPYRLRIYENSTDDVSPRSHFRARFKLFCLFPAIICGKFVSLQPFFWTRHIETTKRYARLESETWETSKASKRVWWFARI